MKKRKSILDAHADALSGWEQQQLTLEDMRARLKERGCEVSLSRLSDYLARQRSERLQAALLEQISSGARQVREVEAQFAKNPAPEMETLIKLYRVLILKLSTRSQVDPSLLDLATALTKQAMDFEKVLLKRAELGMEERRLQLLEQKAAQADAAREVVDSTLTAEQKEAEYRRIFGMS